MSDATGWSQAETAAAKQQLITDTCKMEEVEIVLAVLRESPFVPYDSPLKKLTIADVEPNIKRQKTYEMSTKVNAMVTLLSHGFSLEDATEAIPFFDDPQQVCARSGESVRRYQETIYANENAENSGEGGDGETAPNSGRLMPDLSDQIQNSPMIDKNRSEK